MEIFELIENGDYHAIREEIESFDLEIVNEEGDTPLHYAVKNEDFELLEILLAYVPDIDVENEEGDTALHLAIKTSDIEWKFIFGAIINYIFLNETLFLIEMFYWGNDYLRL